MHHFHFGSGELYVEGLSVRSLAEKYGTPLYIYSAQTIIDHYQRLSLAMAPVDHWICYALKANSNLGLLSLLAKQGSGFDLVSGGELQRVIKAGGDPARCTFAGVGKTRAEIIMGLEAGVYCFIVESEAELEQIARVAAQLKTVAPVALRVNPNVAANTHAKITTGTYENKFGIAFEAIEKLYARAAKMPALRLRGVQMHIGSQITEVEPFALAVEKMVPLVQQLKRRHSIEFFDIGGGIGIVYQGALASGSPEWWHQPEAPLTPGRYAERLLPLLQGLGLRILLEPGRYLVGNAGILVTEVLYRKETGSKNFVIVDAAMNDLVRPAMYEAFHEIVPVVRRGGKTVESDVVGPVCESGDCFAKDRPLPAVQPGDFLALMSAGAYGFSMASHYNTRPRPAELLVKGNRVKVVRRRETVEDLLRGESV